MLQIALTILIYLILVIPAGVYVYHIAAGKHTFADPVFNRVDGAIYKVCGVNPKKGMNWKKYAVSLVITNGIMILLGYIILRIQSIGMSCKHHAYISTLTSFHRSAVIVIISVEPASIRAI